MATGTARTIRFQFGRVPARRGLHTRRGSPDRSAGASLGLSDDTSRSCGKPAAARPGLWPRAPARAHRRGARAARVRDRRRGRALPAARRSGARAVARAGARAGASGSRAGPMGGRPLRQDPGTPAGFASYLLMGGQAASVLMHGIWVFALMGSASVFALVRTLWGALAGVVAAALWAVLPIAQDLLGWHGLANDAALALMALVLLYVAALLSDGLGWLEATGLGLSLVALCAAHRLSFLVTLGGVGLALLVGLAAKRGRGELVRGAVRTAVAALVICPGVAYTVIETDHKFGGTQGYRAYLSTKVHLHLVVNDLSWVFSVVGVLAFVLALWWLRRERTLLPFVALLLVVVALAYSWVVHFPLAYVRMAYYVPLALVPLVAMAVTRLLRPRLAALAALALTLAIAVPAWGAAGNVHRFYDFANHTTLSGMRAVSADLRPGDTVVADRCWSFLSAWLLHADTLPALDPADILPKAEVGPAAHARAILAGTPRGRALARQLHVRFILVNPLCVSQDGRRARPPRLGRPFFVSSRPVATPRPG